jgi:hypothetical protein
MYILSDSRPMTGCMTRTAFQGLAIEPPAFV